jgi:hypothetical protein
MLVTVGSVKGSPGATTLAVLLAATWPTTSTEPGPLILEADCAGGDLGGRCWLPDAPGLTSLATAARSGRVTLRDHASRPPIGVEVMVAPAARQPATIAVGLLIESGVDTWLSDDTVIADVGRLDPGAPSNGLVDAADALVIVSHGDEASLLRLSDAGLPRAKASLVITGDCAYSPDDITRVVGVPVAAVLPWDQRAALAVWGRGAPGRAWTKRGLPAAVRALGRSLSGTTPVTSAQPRDPTTSRTTDTHPDLQVDGAAPSPQPESSSASGVRT